VNVITTGTGSNGVCLLGEAWGTVEAQRRLPFQGPAGARLARMLGLGGYRRDDFLITNVCSFQPPQNREPTDQEIAAWWPETSRLIRESGVRAVVPLGNVPLSACTGETGILRRRGYLHWSDSLQLWAIPTVHPAYILRGNANWTPVWLSDVEKALHIAAHGPPPAPQRQLLLDPPIGHPRGLGGDSGSHHPTGRFLGDRRSWGILDGSGGQKSGGPRPTVTTAWEWIEAWRGCQRPPLAWDIETAGKGTDEEEAELAAGQEVGTIYRIGFAYRTEGETRALSLPWGTPFLPLVQALLQGAPISVVWNRHFDVPRVRAHGLAITGALHDAQEAWHVLYPDLKKSLEFVASILIPGQPYWKDQAYDHPAFYNATDAAVTIELFERLVGGLLPEAGLAEVYARDVQGLNALLMAMGQRGLPVDQAARADVAHHLSTERQHVLAAMQALVPPNAKRTKIWKRRKPSWGETLPETVKVRMVERIARATKTRPARTVVEEQYREQLPFVPSNTQLKAYAKVKGYRLPTVTDRDTGQTRETADEAALRRLALTHEQDPLFPLVLRYRELDRWLGTYVGRL